MKTLCTVHAIAQKTDGKIIILQRAESRSHPGAWNCITGHIKECESAENAALRELKEETNLTGDIVKTTKPFWKDVGDIRWIIVASLISVNQPNDLKIDRSESQDYKWVNPDEDIVKTSEALTLSLKNLELI